MLTSKNRSAHQAIDYYSQTYDNSGLTTRWYGQGAAMLGLSGEIKDKEIFANVCRGRTPDGNGRLGRNTKRAAIDCTFSAPKSVSLSALVGGDKRLVDAHRQAVEKTLYFMEKQYTQTRVRIGKERPRIKTGNLIAAQFCHYESRELDPHLHTHALVMNLTQTENGRWYSLYNNDIYKNKKLLGRLYQRYLKMEVQKLGYETERRKHGMFEIKGYREEDLIEFSKRRQQIIAKVGEACAKWKTREEAWEITRKAKQFLPLAELKEMWRTQVLDLGIVLVIFEIKSQQKEFELNQIELVQKSDLQPKARLRL
jgi:conjugative relaxase-like TrwC/TraI family protein